MDNLIPSFGCPRKSLVVCNFKHFHSGTVAYTVEMIYNPVLFPDFESFNFSLCTQFITHFFFINFDRNKNKKTTASINIL